MSKISAKVRSIADVDGGTILAVVEIHATPERVFHALSDGAELVAWWGSGETYKTTKWTGDVRVGGTWRSEGKDKDGGDFSVGGEFLEVDSPHLLVQTWIAPWDGMNETVIRYQLEPLLDGQATRLTLRHDGFAGRADSCRAHAEGWERVLGWLTRHVESVLLGEGAGGSGGGGGAKRQMYFLCRLIPPRVTFPGDMTQVEAAAMSKHAAYWRSVAARGNAIAVGPVMDAKGTWGVAVVEVESEGHAQTLLDDDPVMRASLGFRFEKAPMMSAILRS